MISRRTTSQQCTSVSINSVFVLTAGIGEFLAHTTAQTASSAFLASSSSSVACTNTSLTLHPLHHLPSHPISTVVSFLLSFLLFSLLTSVPSALLQSLPLLLLPSLLILLATPVSSDLRDPPSLFEQCLFTSAHCL